MAQQTAVEWLVNRWKKLQAKGEKMTWQQVIDITELSKEIEKEQIINACVKFGNNNGVDIEDYEEYYNETYNK